MLKDIPYSVLTKDRHAYEIMLLRDQYNNTYTDIARDYKISTSRVVQLYSRIKIKQKRLYINHISIVLGYKSTTLVSQVYDAAYECYQDRAFACAYLEKKYERILTDYRDGDPGMPIRFIQNMPPLKTMSQKTINCIVKMREHDNLSFVKIAEELHITRAKAIHTYKMYYYEKVLAFINLLQEKAESDEEKSAVWTKYIKDLRFPKQSYDMLTRELIDE